MCSSFPFSKEYCGTCAPVLVLHSHAAILYFYRMEGVMELYHEHGEKWRQCYRLGPFILHGCPYVASGYCMASPVWIRSLGTWYTDKMLSSLRIECRWSPYLYQDSKTYLVLPSKFHCIHQMKETLWLHTTLRWLVAKIIILFVAYFKLNMQCYSLWMCCHWKDNFATARANCSLAHFLYILCFICFQSKILRYLIS